MGTFGNLDEVGIAVLSRLDWDSHPLRSILAFDKDIFGV